MRGIANKFGVLLLLIASCSAQILNKPNGGTGNTIGMADSEASHTVAALGAAGTAGRVKIVSDGATASDCTAGSGVKIVFCTDTGAAWTALSVGGGGGGATAWGDITGTLSAQIDLQAALDAKVATATTVNGHALSANVTVDYSDLTGKPTLGTAAAKDIPASGDASSSQVVYGTDTRLTNARTPTAHATSHVTGGSDVIANAVAAGNAGLMSGTDKTKLDGIASGATVAPALSSTNPVIDGVAAPGVGTTTARADHVHPTDTSRAASNAATTVNGQSCTLSSTCTVTAAPTAHATTHVTGGSDIIANAVAAGNAGLMSGADKTKLDGIAAGATVAPALSSTTPVVDGTGTVGVETTTARADHVHPTDTTRAPLASPTFTGTVSGVTATMVGLGNVTNDAQTKAAVVPNTAPSAGQVLAGNAGGTAYAPVAMSGDCTLSSAGAITCVRLNGANFTVNTSGLPTVVDGITTAGQGVQVVQCIVSAKVETGADATLLSCTPASAVGTYEVCIALDVSAATSATLGWTLTWTNTKTHANAPTNMALFQMGVAAPALTFTAAASNSYYSCVPISVSNAGTAIVVKTTFSGTSIAYNATATVTRII